MFCCILEDDVLIKELNKTDSKTHSENLMPLVDELFKSSGISLSDVNVIACSIGPGSFTGIRIGIASVKAMAEVYNLPVVGVTSLETLAYSVQNSNSVSLIDARNNQVYCGVFNKNHELQEDYLADDINAVLPHIDKYLPVTFIGNGAILHKELIEKKFKNVLFSDNNVQSAYLLGKCAYDKWKKGNTLTADTLLPLYLRKSQAERMKQE